MARWLAATGGGQQPAFAAIPGVPEEFANHANTICAADLRGEVQPAADDGGQRE